ncbi:MAG TPA: SURF1 family protein [Gemmatimonadaceae bacterium]|nr:SURF1 family protein [Gemmatimonadaceae bacterium]
MSRRAIGFVIFAILVAAGCVRLGFWQLHRLAERRATNAKLAERLSRPPAPALEAMRDTATAEYRRATAAGTYDWDHELSLAARTHEGSPGANILTPLRLPGTDTAVLVNRGWVYAADAMSVDFIRWREPNATAVTGYLVGIPRGGHGMVSSTSNPRVVRRLQYDSLAKRMPYPIAPFILVATDNRSPGVPTSRDSTPARLPPPLLDEGPHLGYAIQWFAFAVIGLVGAAFVARADRRGRLHATQTQPGRLTPSGTRNG